MSGPYISGGGSASFPQTGANRTRAEATEELASYVGGETRGDMLVRAGASWDAAVRKFNEVPWKFNRVSQDLLLDSTMPDNTTAPSISRDAGSGAGFVLSVGKSIEYWVEERVKDGAGNILKRNFAPLAAVAVLAGDGSTDKPVITRPATVGADTTHWALYGTAATPEGSGGATGRYPNGVQLGEVAIATTTIEDTRTGNNPMLPAAPILYEPSDFTLLFDFRNHRRAWMVDADGFERYRLAYEPWERMSSVFNQRIAITSVPAIYTVRNTHNEGKVILFPRLRLPATWPILRLQYNRWIAFAVGSGDRLNVPRDVDEAIFSLAIANIIGKVKSFEAARDARILAEDAFVTAKQNHRDWPDRS